MSQHTLTRYDSWRMRRIAPDAVVHCDIAYPGDGRRRYEMVTRYDHREILVNHRPFGSRLYPDAAPRVTIGKFHPAEWTHDRRYPWHVTGTHPSSSRLFRTFREAFDYALECCRVRHAEEALYAKGLAP